jgi:demethylmenaquinone methyltransferase/2-methoxy-6-polyprenyl-1,4-benzoquinol methylase/phosphoethanolamine N-methyltransferase
MHADVHSGQTHSHAGPETPATEGIILRRAGIYNLIFSPLLRKSEKTLLNLAGVKPGSKVLDVGCGPASLTLAAKRRSGPTGEVCGVDASPQMIAEARKQAQKAHLELDFRHGVAEKLPWENHKFDAVISRLVFHHLPGDLKEQALAEIYRVLKPGGICLVVDFELNTFPGPKFIKRHVEGMHQMMRVDVAEYAPLFEANHFQEVAWGKTGHAALSYVKGVKPLQN